jgi:hypothetical protein
MSRDEKLAYMRRLHDRAVALRRKLDAVERITGVAHPLPPGAADLPRIGSAAEEFIASHNRKIAACRKK